MDQALPFQCSDRVSGRLFGAVSAKPTAEQSEAPAQVTPERTLAEVLGLRELATIDHAVPFQCSASVCPGEPVKPTSQQSEVLAQATRS